MRASGVDRKKHGGEFVFNIFCFICAAGEGAPVFLHCVVPVRRLPQLFFSQ